MGRKAEAEAVVVEAPPEKQYRAVALIPEAGGYKIAVLAMPLDDVQLYCVTMSEPEVFPIQLALAARALEESSYGELDSGGNVVRERCPKCDQPALVTHPTKPVKLCAACSARIEI